MLIYSFDVSAKENSKDTISKDTILVVHDQAPNSTQPFLRIVVEALADRLSNYNVQALGADDQSIAILENKLKSEASCILTIGKQALKKTLATRVATPIFSTYVSKIELDILVTNYAKFGSRLSGIYHEQSFARQLALIDALNKTANNNANEEPKDNAVILILGRQTRYFIPYFKQATSQHSMELLFNILPHHVSPRSYLDKQENNSGFLVLLNEDEHYSASNLEFLLVTSYEKQIPMIGSTKEQAQISAVASVYTPMDKLIDELTIELPRLCNLQSNEKAPSARYSQYYQVTINQEIAKYFGYQELDEEQLTEEMRNYE